MGFESQNISWRADRLLKEGIINKERREKIGLSVVAIEARTIQFVEDALTDNCKCRF